ELARERARALGPDISVAIVAVDHATGDVLARVAGADYFDERRAGQVDMTQAVRSPGSTLKPFIYGIGFEDGLIHPESLIEDRPVRYGSYAPENFDLTFQGTVTVRRALQLSLNVPAVAVLDRIGASRFTARLAQAGAALILPQGEVPGLAMGLGGVGMRFEGKGAFGVWVGRPEGAPVPGLVGRVAAAPILFDAFARSGKSMAPLPAAPKGALVASTSKLPPPLQRFRPGAVSQSGQAQLH